MIAAKALSVTNTPSHLEITRRTGWHNGASFIYPDETFGELSGKLLYDGATQIDPALGLRRGSLEAWKDGLREPSRFSDYLIFTISVGPASALLDIISETEGAVFHLHGTETLGAGKSKSSSGKTTATRTGISTMSRCEKSDLFTFAITERAVEDFCFCHNHLAVALDEEGRGADSGGTTSKVKTAKLPYLIPGGRGTVRSNKATQDAGLRNLSWSVLALSTGESPLDGHYSIQRKEGQQVRMIGIPVQPGSKGGIFNRIEGTPIEISQKCKHLVRKVETTIGENYGVAMPEYLRELVRHRPELRPRIKKIIDGFVKKVGADTEPWQRRFAEKFGIVLAGAILMSEYKVAPWTRKRARHAITRLYRNARAANLSSTDVTDIFLKRLKKLVGKGKHFPVVKKGLLAEGDDIWGAVRTDGKGNQVLAIRLSRFKNLGVTSEIQNSVLSQLESRSLLIRSADGKRTTQMMIGGSSARHRYVCLDPKFLK